MTNPLREWVRQRAQGSCEYCQMPEDLDTLIFHWDHIISQKHQGPTEESNLAWSCFSCNNHKQSDISGMDPTKKTGRVIRLFNPRTDKWKDHFRWERLMLKGKTPRGRVTIYVLGINRPHRVELRRLHVIEGLEHFSRMAS